MSKKIKNEETKIIKDQSLNDADILNDTLLSFKFLVDNFAIGLNESSNKWIYEHYKKLLIHYLKHNKLFFNLRLKKVGIH